MREDVGYGGANPWTGYLRSRRWEYVAMKGVLRTWTSEGGVQVVRASSGPRSHSGPDRKISPRAALDDELPSLPLLLFLRLPYSDISLGSDLFLSK